MSTHTLSLKDITPEDFLRYWDSLGSTPSSVAVEESDYSESEVSEEPATTLSWMEQERQRFIASLPPTPFCSWDKRIRKSMHPSADKAVNYPYVQLNTPWMIRYIRFDVDRGDFNKEDLEQCKTVVEESSALAWEKADLPAPTFTVINPVNGHADLIYEIDQIPAPNLKRGGKLVCNKGGRDLLKMVIAGYRKLLGADRVITHQKLLSKNPFYGKWRTRVTGARYTLSELAEYLPDDIAEIRKPVATLPKKIRHHKSFDAIIEEIGVGAGRNDILWEAGKRYAYAQVCECSDKTELYALVHAYLIDINDGYIKQTFRSRYHGFELAELVERIADWTWEHRQWFMAVKPKKVGIMNLPKKQYLPRKEWKAEIKKRQSLGGKYNGEQRRAVADLKAKAIMQAVEAMRSEGLVPSVRTVASRTGFPKSTVARLMSSKGVQEGKKEGVSHEVLSEEPVIRGVKSKGKSDADEHRSVAPAERGAQVRLRDGNEERVTRAKTRCEAPVKHNHRGGG